MTPGLFDRLDVDVDLDDEFYKPKNKDIIRILGVRKPEHSEKDLGGTIGRIPVYLVVDVEYARGKAWLKGAWEVSSKRALRELDRCELNVTYKVNVQGEGKDKTYGLTELEPKPLPNHATLGSQEESA